MIKEFPKTTNELWAEQIRMFEYIVQSNLDVEETKNYWLNVNYTDVYLIHNCFFCTAAKIEPGCACYDSCVDCPGRMFDDFFECSNPAYVFNRKPKAFLDKLKEIDSKRKRICIS